jgi:uncharacterized damage-inducible protein DinB
MTDREMFAEKAKEEAPIFERVFKALPVDQLHHTHHPKSKTAGDLAVQMADEAESFVGFLETGKVVWGGPTTTEANVDTIASMFVKGMNDAAAKAEEMTDEDWNSPCAATMNGQEVWKTTKGKMAWGLLFDLVHHRGQLSTYIRPMGGKVPSIYGPSADTAE